MRGPKVYTRFCQDCGRALEIGEVCNCRQAVPGMPRDGLRALCPEFQHRSSYRGTSYITCAGAKVRFANVDCRNQHYRDYCCSDYKTCCVLFHGERAKHGEQ